MVNNYFRRIPKYYDDSDYTTNAPSYYDDLARKSKLIKLLSERIWEYEKTLDIGLENIETILDNYIEIVDGKLSLIDFKIGEGFNQEINELLIEWVNDGTLDQIINVELFNVKLDTATYDDDMITVNAKLNPLADLSGLIWNDENADNTEVLNNAIASGKKIMLGDGVLTIKGRIRLDLAPKNSYDIEGVGENTVINCVGENAGFYDKYGSQENENYHIKKFGNLYLQGDGTNIGFNFQSLLLNAYNLVISGFDKGIYLRSGGYGSTFHNVFVRRNKFGVYFDDLVTTCTFTDFYASVQHDPDGAGVYFNDYVEKIKIQGIIQANRSAGIWYGTDFRGDVIIDCYFELNGDRDKGIDAIKNDAVDGRIVYSNSKMPHNVMTNWVNGDYHVGHRVLFDNTRITTPMYVGDTVVARNCTFEGGGAHFPKTTAIFEGLNTFSNHFGTDGAGGISIKLPVNIDNVITDHKNLNENPFSIDLPCVVATGVNRPILEIDSSIKYGDYNTTRIMFEDNIIGNAGISSLLITGGKQVISSPGNFIVCSFLIKGNKEGTLQFISSGGIPQAIAQKINVTTEWQKFVFIGNNRSTVQVNANLFMYNISDLTDFNVNITGIVIHDNLPNDPTMFKNMLQGKFNY